jgi:hypothetical protein
MTKRRNYILSLFGADTATQVDKKGLVYEKEIVRAGTFTKPGRNGKVIKHVITEDDVKRWPLVFAEMKADGLKVPIPLEHTANPERNRATVIDMMYKPNSKGIPATFARIKFRDLEAAKMAQTTDVSIFVPDQIHNGTKNKSYRRAIEHVALTDYPVINDLEPFKPIQFSLKSGTDTDTEDDDVNLRELATQMGIDPQITDEQQIMLAMSQKIVQMRGPGGGQPGGAAPQPGQPGAAPAPAPMAGAGPPRPPMMPPRPPGAFSGKSRIDDSDEGHVVVEEPIALSGSLLRMAKENREQKIANLLEKRSISPVVAKDLIAEYCTDEALQFSHIEQYEDNFERMVGILSKNPSVIPNGKKLPAQTVALSRDGETPQQSALAVDAERRAKAEATGTKYN